MKTRFIRLGVLLILLLGQYTCWAGDNSHRFKCSELAQLFTFPWAISSVGRGYFKDLRSAIYYEKIRRQLKLQDSEFFHLAVDPAHRGRININSVEEAKTGILAMREEIVNGALRRGPREIEFYDAHGYSWDVKSPRSPGPRENWEFDLDQVGRSIQHQIEVFQFDRKAGGEVKAGVLINHGALRPVHRYQLRSWLGNFLEREQKNLIHFVPRLYPL